MNDKLYENGYVVLENFFTDKQVDFFMSQTVESIANKEMVLGKDMQDGESVHPMTWNVNSHKIWENTLYSVLPQVSKITDEELLPTYSFQRVYLNGSSMSHHTDWPWCQISLTINLGQSEPYPIYLTSLKTKKSVEIIQKPGDAILYLGHNISHYRDTFEGEWYSQLFLHYVIDNENMESFQKLDRDIFDFELKNNVKEYFYPKEVEKIKEDLEPMDMLEKDKDKIIKLDDGGMFKTTNRKPRLDINDVDPEVSLHGGQYNVKTMNHFMDTIHQTFEALTPEFCKELIDLYEDYAKRRKVKHGLTHRGLDNSIKDTGELDLLKLPKDEVGDYIDNLRNVSDHCIKQYTSKFGLLQHYNSLELFDGGVYYPMWEIHKYEKGTGHYEAWHVEGSNLYEYGNRMFVSMFYLNDVEEGGRTVFPYSKSAIKCETGKHLSFPTFWPYVHYAETPISDHKYIVTTWLNKLWPKQYTDSFVQVADHDKQEDVRKTKFVFDEG